MSQYNIMIPEFVIVSYSYLVKENLTLNSS